MLQFTGILLRRFLALFLCVSMNAWSYPYVVQEGDTLSHHVAGVHIPGPVWGVNGSFKRVLELNPKLKNPSLIYPGQVIELGEQHSTQVVQDSTQPTVVEPVAKSELKQTEKSSLEVKYFYLILSPEFHFFKIDSTDIATGATGRILSKSHFVFPVTLNQRWTDDVSTFERVSFGHTALSQPTGARTLDSLSLNQYGFGLGVRLFELSKHVVSIELGLDQKYFLRAASASSLKVDSVAIPNLTVRSDHELLLFEPYRFGVGLGGSLLAPASESSYRTKLGYAYNGNFFLNRFFGTSLLTARVGYTSTQENTTVSNQTNADLGFGIEYNFRIGRDQKNEEGQK